MNTPEAETQAVPQVKAQELPVTPEERKVLERAVWAINELYRRRRTHNPETGAYYDALTTEELGMIENAILHIAKRFKLEHILEEAKREWQEQLLWKTVIPPVKRDSAKPLPLP